MKVLAISGVDKDRMDRADCGPADINVLKMRSIAVGEKELLQAIESRLRCLEEDLLG